MEDPLFRFPMFRQSKNAVEELDENLLPLFEVKVIITTT